MANDELVRAVADEMMRRLRPHLSALAGAAADPEYLTLAEVERRTSFSYDYVYDAVRRGDLPAVRKGREWRVALADMRAWMDKDRAGVRTPARSELRAKVSRYLPGLAA